MLQGMLRGGRPQRVQHQEDDGNHTALPGLMLLEVCGKPGSCDRARTPMSVWCRGRERQHQREQEVPLSNGKCRQNSRKTYATWKSHVLGENGGNPKPACCTVTLVKTVLKCQEQLADLGGLVWFVWLCALQCFAEPRSNTLLPTPRNFSSNQWLWTR